MLVGDSVGRMKANEILYIAGAVTYQGDTPICCAKEISIGTITVPVTELLESIICIIMVKAQNTKTYA